LIGHLGEAPPKIFFRWGTLGPPRLSYQSDRASILGVGTSKPSLLSARLLRTNPTFGISLPQHAAKASVLLGDYIWRSNRNMTDFAPQLHFLSCPGCPTPKTPGERSGAFAPTQARQRDSDTTGSFLLRQDRH
jgi:hypothetical protein